MKKMKLALEITFMDGSKETLLPDTWDEFKYDKEIFWIESNGQAFSWYPMRNIKSVVALTQFEIVKMEDGK